MGHSKSHRGALNSMLQRLKQNEKREDARKPRMVKDGLIYRCPCGGELKKIPLLKIGCNVRRRCHVLTCGKRWKIEIGKEELIDPATGRTYHPGYLTRVK